MGNVSPYLLHLRKEAEDCAGKRELLPAHDILKMRSRRCSHDLSRGRMTFLQLITPTLADTGRRYSCTCLAQILSKAAEVFQQYAYSRRFRGRL